MATAEVLLDRSQYVRVNIGTRTTLILQAHRDHVRIIMSDAKPAIGNTAFHTISGEDVTPLQIPHIDTNVWALSMTAKSSLISTEVANDISITKDFGTEVMMGNVPGYSSGQIVGRNVNIGSTEFETVWDQGGDKKWLPGLTQLYASSTDDTDTATVAIPGLDENWLPVTATATLDGNTPVALSIELFRVNSAAAFTSVAGEVYIAESGASTTIPGKPDDATLIQSKIPLSDPSVELNADFASAGLTHNGFLSVPAGVTQAGLIFFATTDKNCNIDFTFWVRPEGGAWYDVAINHPYQSVVSLPLENRSRVDEKSDIELRAKAGSAGGRLEVNYEFWYVDNV